MVSIKHPIFQISKKIVIISDSIHVAKRIFDSFTHPYQIYSAAISCKLRRFFEEDSDNSIEFWDCPSYYNWDLHLIIDKETKKFDLILIFLCKSSWDFSRKSKCDNICKSWESHFQASEDKEQNFLELLDDNLHSIMLSIAKGSP